MSVTLEESMTAACFTSHDEPATDVSANVQGVVPARTVALPGSNYGRYLVIEEIARGATGVVLRGYDPRLQREVALKTLRTEDPSAQWQQSVLLEARAMAKLSHPNIVTIYDVELAGDDVVIAMEHVRGTTLQGKLAAGLPWREIVSLFVAAGRGLAAAHAAELFHRDFRAANVLVGDDGRVRVTDFGLAPASEQHEPAALGAAADQYAFCVALWEALTGQPPAAHSDLHTAELHNTQGRPPWPRDATAVRDALARGLAARHGERWPSMDALLGALTHATRRRHRMATAGVVLATLAVPGLAWGAYRQQQAERCTGAKQQLTDVWDEARRDTAQRAFAATGVAYAREAWQRVGPELDAYASAWVSTRTEACEAATVRGEHPLAVMDLQMACLHRAKVGLRAAAELLTRADAQVVEKAHQIVAGLPALERCVDVQALQAQVAPPDPADEDAVESIRTELAEVGALRAAGKYSETLARMQELAPRAEAISYGPLQTEVLLELGWAWDYATRYAEARATLERALRSALAHKQWQEAQRASAALTFIVGSRQTRPTEGMAYATTAKGLLRADDVAARANFHSYLAGTLEAMGRYAESEAEFRTAVALSEGDAESGTYDAALYRGYLGVNLKFQGRLAEAVHELRSAVALLKERLPAEHPQIVATQFDLAHTLYSDGRYAEAEHLLRIVLDAQRRVFAADHANIAVSHGSLGNVLAAQGRFEEAEVEFQTSLRLQRDVPDPNHVNIAIARGSFALALVGMGRLEQAENETRAALETLKAAMGDEHFYVALTHNILGIVLKAQGDAEGAEWEFRAALAKALRFVTPEHPHVARFMNGLGSVLEAQGRYEEAEAQQREALAVQMDSLGPEHPHVAQTRARLASSLRGQGRYDESEAEYREALAVRERSQAGAHPVDAELQTGLAQTLMQVDRVSEALPLLETAWASWGDDARMALAARAELATCLARALSQTRGDAARARALDQTAHTLSGPGRAAGDLACGPAADRNERGFVQKNRSIVPR